MIKIDIVYDSWLKSKGNKIRKHLQISSSVSEAANSTPKRVGTGRGIKGVKENSSFGFLGRHISHIRFL